MSFLQAVRRKMREWVVGDLRVVDPRFYQAIHQGDPAHSGHTVTVDSAMQLSAVWSCVRLISETVATLPLPLYRRGPDGRKTLANNHPLYFLLHDQPNADMTAAEFWESMVACLCLHGNAFAVKELQPSGRLTALIPLRPERMQVLRSRSGAVVYRYSYPDPAPWGRDWDPARREAGGQVAEFNEDEIFHLKGFGCDGLIGMSPISYARHSLGNAMAVEESVGHSFQNMVRPAGVLTTDQVLTKQQQDQYLRGLAEDFAGTINAGKVMPLMAGFKYQPISLNPEDMQMLQTRAFAVEEICRWFRIPPFMIGHSEKVTSWGTGIEQQMIAFQSLALRPYLVRIEQAVSKSLISPYERRVLKAEFNLEGLLRADSQGRAAFYGQMVEKGIYTRNEIREKENLPPLEGGDKLTVQVNQTFLDLLGKQPPAPANQTPALEAAL